MVDQPGAGTAHSYKIRGHTRQRRSTKPYARPSEVKKKSLVEKVRDYLTPSWFFGYFQTNELDDDSSDSEVDIVEEDTTRNEDSSHPGRDISFQENPAGLLTIGEEDSILEDEEGTQLEGTTSGLEHSHFSECLENNNKGETCIRDEITTQLRESENRNRNDYPDNDFNASEPAASTESALSSSNLSYSSQLKRKPLPSVLHSRTLTSSLFQHSGLPAATRPQGNPLLSLSSATRTASYSSQNPSFGPSRMNTSSGNVGTSSTSLRRTQPVASVTSAPGFSVSTFVTPVARSFTNKVAGSPFYPGRITYGGALSNSGYTSSSRKRQRRNSPNSELYQPVRKHQIRAKPLPNASRGGPTSKTAQRILEALESVSSPLRDVRRIPSPQTSPSDSPLSFSIQPSQLRAKPPRIGPRISSLQAKFLGGPPVEALSTPQIAKVTGIDSRESSNSRTSSTPFPTTNNPSSKHSDKSLFGDMHNTVLKTCLTAGFTPKGLPTSLSPGEKTSKTSGKMKTAPRGATHYSLKNNAEDDEIVNPLPEIVNAIPLPVNTTKYMSSFLFTSNKAVETSTSPKVILEANTAQDKTAAESTKNGFIFSNPTRKRPIVSVKEALAIADEEVSFMFSQPVSVKAKEDKIQNTVMESVKDTPKNSPFTSKSPDQGVETISSTVISNERTVASATRNSLAKMFAAAPGEWSCSACMLRNKAADQKCVACGTAGASKTLSEQSKNNTNEATKIPSNGIDLAKKFAPKEGRKCEMCMIDNEASAVICAACSSAKLSTEKSGSSDLGMNKGQSMDLRIKFAPPANTWSCEMCMVRNKIEDTKCVACKTAKPGATAAEIDLKKKFAAPADSWKCETCMITNQSSEVKCMACETNKPGTEAGASSSSSGGGFTFGGGAPNTSVAPSFTFGNAVTEKQKSGFTFGSETAAAETHKSGFTFGLSSTKEENTTPKFTFGASGGSGSDSKTTGFTFAGADKELTSKNVNEKENEKEISIVKENLNKVAKPEVRAPPLNIAQAAAAGLLKVPGISSTAESKDTKASTNQPTFPLQPSKSPPNGPASFLPPPKNLPDSTTTTPASTATAKKPAPSLETVSKPTTEIVKITPFNFGASTNTQTSLGEKTGNHGFTFGMTTSSEPQITPFNVGAIAGDKRDGKSTFNLGVSVTTSKKSSPAPVFKFGGAEQSTAVSDAPSLFQNAITTSAVPVAKSQTSGLFPFTATATEEKSKQPVFNFGALNGPPSSTAGNNTTQTQAVSAANALFNFTAGQPTNADTENHNSLGGEDMEADSNSNHDSGQAAFGSNGGFGFTAQTSGNASGLFGSSGTPGTSGTGGFNFGSAGSTSIPSAFQFGTSSNSNANTPSGGFNFGASTVAPGSGSTFVFGAASTNTTSAPASSSTPSAGFAFSQAANTTFAVGQRNPGVFNVGATSTQPRVFKKALRRARR